MHTKTINCEYCGKRFDFPPSQNRRFCSRACAYAGLSGKPHSTYEETILKVCETCGISFRCSPSHADQRKFCSLKCKGIASRGRKPHNWIENRPHVTCETCGVAFLVKPSQATTAHFCSRACFSKSDRKKEIARGNLPESLHGAAHPRWKGGERTDYQWKKQRKFALIRDGYKCRRCGITVTGKNNDVHHVVAWLQSKDHSLDNLVTLCASCHSQLEWLYAKSQREICDAFCQSISDVNC